MRFVCYFCGNLVVVAITGPSAFNPHLRSPQHYHLPFLNCFTISQRNLNRILAHVRPATNSNNSTHNLAHHPARSPEDFDHLCDLVTEAWNRCVNDRNTSTRPTELHGIFVLGDIIAGREAGFGLPPVSATSSTCSHQWTTHATWTIGQEWQEQDAATRLNF